MDVVGSRILASGSRFDYCSPASQKRLSLNKGLFYFAT
jgi:hypothetical protein